MKTLSASPYTSTHIVLIQKGSYSVLHHGERFGSTPLDAFRVRGIPTSVALERNARVRLFVHKLFWTGRSTDNTAVHLYAINGDHLLCVARRFCIRARDNREAKFLTNKNPYSRPLGIDRFCVL
jgi:hypothetical protein